MPSTIESEKGNRKESATTTVEEEVNVWFKLSNSVSEEGSLVFGHEFQACFQSEEPGLLYQLGHRDPLKNRDGTKETPCIETGQRCIMESPGIRIVPITYTVYSHFLIWLLEEGLCMYPSSLLESAVKQINTSQSTPRLKEIFKETFQKNKCEKKELNEASGLYLISFLDKKTKKTQFSVKKARKMIHLMQQILLVHLRGGWLPNINENIRGGLGSFCRNALFPKNKIVSCNEVLNPAFDQGTDGEWVCITDWKWEDERRYFHPSSPMHLVILMNRIVSKPNEEGGKYKIGLEDTGSIDVPFQEKDDHLLAHMFTKEKLDKDKRFKQLVQDLVNAPEKNKVQRSMSKDTKVITYLEYLFFISTLKICQNMVGVPCDIFELLYQNFILECKPYTPTTLLDYFSDKGWKGLLKTENPRKFNQLLGLVGGNTGERYPQDMIAWVHVVRKELSKGAWVNKEDTQHRFLPSISKISHLGQNLKHEKNFYKDFLNFLLKVSGVDYENLIRKKCESMLIRIEAFEPLKMPVAGMGKVVKGKKNHSESEISSDEEDDALGEFIVPDNYEDDEVSDEEETIIEDPKDMPSKKDNSSNNKEEIYGLFMKAIQTKISESKDNNRGTKQQRHGEKQQTTASLPPPPPSNNNVLPVLPLPPLLPVIRLNDTQVILHNTNQATDSMHQDETESIQSADHADSIDTPDDTHWRLVLMQKQGDFFSSSNFYSQHSSPQMISYTKHNFAPQLYTPGIAAIMRKANIDELKARLFIMMIIDKKEAEIRHLSALTSDVGLQETYTSQFAKDIDNDTQHFVNYFINSFLGENQILSEDDVGILRRCYCAHWIFVKQLFKTKEEAFHLQLYESKEWIPVLFDSNALILSSCRVMFQRKDMDLNAALDLPLQYSEAQNLIASIPSISEVLGMNEVKRTSVRQKTTHKDLKSFLDAFFAKHGPQASYRLQCEYNQDEQYPSDINKMFYASSFHLVQHESTCFSDLLYLAALHHLRKGFFLFDCQSGRQQMLGVFLRQACMLKEGVLDFIETLIKMKKVKIARGYAWLLMIFLKHSETSGETLNEKTFNTIMSAVDRNKYIKTLVNHMHTNEVDIAEEEDSREDIEDVFNIKNEIEKKFIDQKYADASLKGPVSKKSLFVFDFVLRASLGNR